MGQPRLHVMCGCAWDVPPFIQQVDSYHCLAYHSHARQKHQSKGRGSTELQMCAVLHANCHPSCMHNHTRVASDEDAKPFCSYMCRPCWHIFLGTGVASFSKETSITSHCLPANCFGKESDQHRPCQEGRKADPGPVLVSPCSECGRAAAATGALWGCVALFAFYSAWFVCPAGCLWDMYEEAFFMLSGLIISHRQVDTEQLKVPIQGRKHNRAPFIFTRKQRHFSSTGNYP